MQKVYNEISGAILIDKPFGITSFQTVSKIRKILNVKKCGHCGTLDPLATGLLIVLIGKSVKLQDSFMKKDKVYSCSFLLGTTTNSGDLDGKTTSQKSFSHITLKDVQKSALKFTGEILQIPPMFSALKYKGKKLYELARKGIEVKRTPRKITVHYFSITSYNDGIAEAKIKCSSGTYIRSLAQDLGNDLGCGAVVKSLRREKIGNFDIKDSLLFNEIQNANKLMENVKDTELLLSTEKSSTISDF
ncbi:MAG: tRNA pseudouridine(55) synthase TruB [Elusimicrobiota bacterium]|jgi:tRNA pseudouridine55 synthase|nr:tRNA pseudouridine(55) synthase TruB [Elusimicrobiota bacterium]